MKKKKQPDSLKQQKPATAASLRELSRLLEKFATSLKEIAAVLDKNGIQKISVRGRSGVDAFIERLDGYVHNARESADPSLNEMLKIGEPRASYHVEDDPPEKRQR